MCVVYTAWLQLHLELFAVLPKSFDSFFECHRILCVPVYILIFNDMFIMAFLSPGQALDELPDHVLYTSVLLEVLQ